MMNLPTVQAPICKKPLFLYLVSSPSAIRALIAQEDRGGVEQPLYYFSHALIDAKTRYPRAERIYLAVVLTYEVHLMTKSHEIKALLRQPILSDKIL